MRRGHEFLDDEGETYEVRPEGVYFAGNDIPVATRVISGEILRLDDEVNRLGRENITLKVENAALEEENRRLRLQITMAKENVSFVANSWKAEVNRLEIDLSAAVRTGEELQGVRVALWRGLLAAQESLCRHLCMEHPEGILCKSHHPDCTDARDLLRKLGTPAADAYPPIEPRERSRLARLDTREIERREISARSSSPSLGEGGSRSGDTPPESGRR